MYVLGIQAIANGIENIVQFFQTLFTFINNIFSSLFMALQYLIQIVPKIMILIYTLPNWLIAFGTITIGISIAYFILGRESGKN